MGTESSLTIMETQKNKTPTVNLQLNIGPFSFNRFLIAPYMLFWLEMILN